MIPRLLVILLGLLGAGPALAADGDQDGCKDPALFPSRMPGFHIGRCESKDFEAHTFRDEKGKEVVVEGRYVTLLYTHDGGAKEPSRVAIQRNYENAVRQIGGARTHVDDDGNAFLRVQRDGREVWVHVNAYITSQYFLTVVEKAAMSQDVVADAAALAKDITAVGHIAVYGIHFDTGKAEVKAESEPTLKEIARLLAGDPALRLHVVGHTDNVGSLDANMKLSQARAEAVVRTLTSRHGVAAARLRGYGVGPLAPVASNDTDEGKARNRRVELVKQ